jgi:hypothetical protein
MVDFQGVCLQRQLRFEKSSGYIFRGVSTIESFDFNQFSFLDSSNNFSDDLEFYQSFSNV